MLPIQRYTDDEHAEFLTDILVTAVEGGCNYWASIDDYAYWYNDLTHGKAKHYDGQPNAYATFIDNEDPDGKSYRIGIDDIDRAVIAIARNVEVKGLHHSYVSLIRDAFYEGESVNIDCELADYIVQYAIFGEVAYS